MVMGLDVATNADICTFQLSNSPKHNVFLLTPEGNDLSHGTPLLPGDKSQSNSETAVPGAAAGPTVTPTTTQEEGEHG